MSNGKPWTINKEIPVVLIFSILAQAGCVIWWTSKLDSRVANLETVVIATDGPTRLAKVETRLDLLERRALP